MSREGRSPRRAAAAPLAREPGQPWFHTALALPEDVFALAANYLADQIAAQSGPADNPLDRNTVIGHAPNRTVSQTDCGA